MSQDPDPITSWKTLLLLVLAVVAVVIIALLLSQVDTYQRRSSVPANVPAIVDLESTVAAGELATIYLPREISPTPTNVAPPTGVPPADQQPLSTPTGGTTAGCDAPSGWKPYTVGPGDTLPKLARTHGTTVYHIIRANCLDYVQLLVGTEILLPGLPRKINQHGTN